MSQPAIKPAIAGAINIPNSALAHHNYTWANMSPQKHVRLSPRPSTSYAPYPSPTYTSAIAAAQHNVNVALGIQNSYTGASGGITILNNNNNSTIHRSQVPHHLQQVYLNFQN